MHAIRIGLVAAAFGVMTSAAAYAQNTVQPANTQNGWQISVHPVLVWVPLGISIGVDVPPSGGDGGESGRIAESRFDGALFAGAMASNGVWRIEGYGIWAAFGGDRPELPFMTVDFDLIYGDARVGRRVARNLYAMVGVRRLVLKYDIAIGSLPRFVREPGVWDPIIGLGWHRVGPKVEWHATVEGGGFGVGADVDFGTTVRVDWKPVRHFGLAAGYSALYLKITDSKLGREVTMKPTVHGPMFGIGFYF
jgi:hypothetical protein